jgi:cytoskeleton protein RodZ
MSEPYADQAGNGAENAGSPLGRVQQLFHRALGRGAVAKHSEFSDSEVGRLLCATRMRLGKDLQQIAKVLHIRYNYLVAMEDGRYEDLPGQAYAIGFVRAYADHLELDGDEVVRRFKEETTGLKRKAALEFIVPTPDSGVPSGLALLVAIALGAAVYGIWYALGDSGTPSVHMVQEVPARLLPPEPPAAPEVSPPAATTPVTPEGAAPSSDAAPEVAAAPPASDAAGDSSDAPGSDTDTPPDAPSDVIVLRATSDSWIQVRDRNAVILTKLLKKGESYTVPSRPGLTLMTANAGGVEILLNDEVLPPLGDLGAVASGIVLDAEHLRPAAHNH